jgi:aldehyde dehydrogenase (NAD+)/coniferyl-aldehyde dehydrogenase
MVSTGARNILPRPLGVVSIIVPWNYPLFLAVGPLVGAWLPAIAR